jgi:hypothetical protein
MKHNFMIRFLLLSFCVACRKNVQDQPARPPVQENFTINTVKQWYKEQPDSLSKVPVDWNNIEYKQYGSIGYWLVGINGQPTFQRIKQGYRKAVFYQDSLKRIREQILEIIPDALTLQRKGNLPANEFTGRIFVYDQNYRLLNGLVYSGGKEIGLIRPKVPQDTGKLRTNLLAVDCTWYQDNYVDSDGEVTVYAEKICNYDLGTGSSGGFNAGVPTNTGGHNGSGGATTGPPPPPPASNLPGENNAAVNPKNLMRCFSNIPDQGATMTIAVYVQEPFPGTSFNIGPNSVGHTAIGMTKSNGQASVTQVFGFYPNASGLAKLQAPSKIVNNGGDLEYNVSITYAVTAENFNKIANYVSNPPGTYDLFGFNCTSFVFYACQAGQINLPNPTTTVGLTGPGGQERAMTPAGLGSSLDNLKNTNNLNKNGGTTPVSKGPCN